MEELIIKHVKNHTVLFDSRSPNYTDQKMRQEAWEEIGREIKISPENAKEKWNKLRRCFCNAINRRRSRRSDEATKKIMPWKFEQQMAFLLPFVEARTTHSTTEQFVPRTNHNNVNLENENDNNEGNEIGIDSESSDEYPIRRENATEVIGTLHRVKRDTRATHKSNNTAFDMDTTRENAKIKRTKYEKCLQRKTNCFCDLDETDMFFLSMARMAKQLPRYEQSRIKLTLSNAVLQADIKNQQRENASSFEQTITQSRQESSSSSNHTRRDCGNMESCW